MFPYSNKAPDRLKKMRDDHRKDNNKPNPDVFPNFSQNQSTAGQVDDLDKPIIVVIHRGRPTGHVSMYRDGVGLDPYPVGAWDPLAKESSSASIKVVFGKQRGYATFEEGEKKLMEQWKKNNPEIFENIIASREGRLQGNKNGVTTCLNGLKEHYLKTIEGLTPKQADEKVEDFCNRLIADKNQRPSSLLEWIKRGRGSTKDRTVFVTTPRKMMEYYRNERGMTETEAKQKALGLPVGDMLKQLVFPNQFNNLYTPSDENYLRYEAIRGWKAPLYIAPSTSRIGGITERMKKEQNESWEASDDNCASKTARALGLPLKYVNATPDWLEWSDDGWGVETPWNLEEYLCDMADKGYFVQISPEALNAYAEKEVHLKKTLRAIQETGQKAAEPMKYNYLASLLKKARS